MKILALESSCDETAAAVVEDGTLVLSNVIASQIPLHHATGGVVPEVAAREHVVKVVPVVEEALRKAGCRLRGARGELLPDIDAIAVTQGPGLLSSLVIGVSAATTLAAAAGKPLIPVNHIAGHIYANWLRERTEPAGRSAPDSILAQKVLVLEGKRTRTLTPFVSPVRGKEMQHISSQKRAAKKLQEPQFPLVVLTVSGGHNELVYMKKHGSFKLLGATLDDAAGEAFDKVARLLGLGYPGGPHISRVAENGNAQRFQFPRVHLDGKGTGKGLRKANYNFSFSGLKTAALNLVKQEYAREGQLSPEFIADCAAGFQEAACDVLSDKLLRAGKEFKAKEVHLAGGVSANRRLRAMAEEKIASGKFFGKGAARPTLRYAENIAYCTDNAAMIAGAGYFCRKKGGKGARSPAARGALAFGSCVLADPNLRMYDAV